MTGSQERLQIATPTRGRGSGSRQDVTDRVRQAQEAAQEVGCRVGSVRDIEDARVRLVSVLRQVVIAAADLRADQSASPKERAAGHDVFEAVLPVLDEQHRQMIAAGYRLEEGAPRGLHILTPEGVEHMIVTVEQLEILTRYRNPGFLTHLIE